MSPNCFYQGLWRYEKWGYPVESAPPGALVLARFLPSVPDIDSAWGGLTNALAGLFCASLDTLDRTQVLEK
jgi:phosphatidylinositol glycan class T